MPPKIKIVDLVDKEVESDAYTITVDAIQESELHENAPPETAVETKAIIQETDEGAPEEVSISITTSESTKKVRNQELVKCKKCRKLLTAKTFKYTHSLKCGEVKKSRSKKSEIKINENVQEETPNPVPIQKVVKDKPQPVQRQHTKPQVVKEVVKTFEEMRRERLTERLKQRAERNINSFKQVLK